MARKNVVLVKDLEDLRDENSILERKWVSSQQRVVALITLMKLGECNITELLAKAAEYSENKKADAAAAKSQIQDLTTKMNQLNHEAVELDNAVLSFQPDDQ